MSLISGDCWLAKTMHTGIQIKYRWQPSGGLSDLRRMGPCSERVLQRASLGLGWRDPLRLAKRRGNLRDGLPCSQLPEDRRQERAARLFDLAAARQPLRDLQKHLGGAMFGGEFRDHLAVVGRRAEQSRIESNRRDRLAFNGLGESA